MSCEQKAQAYDEVPKKAKSRYNKEPTDGYVGYANQILEELFPTLAESEDERIRRKMIEHFKSKTKETWCNMPVKDIIAYLEKQKVLFESGRGLYYYDGEKTTYCGYIATEENPYDFAMSKQEEKKKEPHYTKRNALFDECVKNCDPEVMKRVSDEIDAMLQKEQKPELPKPHKGDDTNPYDMSVSEAQEYAINRGFGIPFNDGEVFVDERYITQTIGNTLRWADEHPKEQKPATPNEISAAYQLGLKAGREEQKPKLYWHKIKANEKLPCEAYIYKLAFEREDNFFGKATIPGFMMPNIPCKIGCDTWYLPVDDIKNLPKEGEKEQKPAEWSDEDENALEYLHELISFGYTENFFDAQTAADMRKWLNTRLKSLRPQSKEEHDAIAKREYERGKRDGYWEGYKKAEENHNNSVTFHYDYPTSPSIKRSCYEGGPCTNPQMDCINCPRKNSGGTYITSPNTASGESKLEAHWKPSEEQMEALSWAINYLTDIEKECASTLALLKFNLKELM